MTETPVAGGLVPEAGRASGGFRDAHRTKDAGAYVSYWHPEIDFVEALGEIRHGRASIADVEPAREYLPPRRCSDSVALVPNARQVLRKDPM